MSLIERAAARLDQQPPAAPAPEAAPDAAPVQDDAPAAPANGAQRRPARRPALSNELARRTGQLSERAQAARRKAANVRKNVPAPKASEPEVQAPPLFEINLQKLETEGFLMPGEGRNQLAQEFRRIKRPLLLNMRKDAVVGNAAQRPANLLMITSALPNEGKTFVSINMAMSMAAEMNRRVLLVDADVAKGNVGRTLGFEPERGLSDILKDDAPKEREVITETSVPGLSILGAGPQDMHMDELYASERMNELTRRLALYDPDRVVIFDAPPLLATTEAAVLARLMGQVLMVVEADRTPQAALSEALHVISECENVSLLLNKVVQGGLGGAYGYGYGYGFGYGYGYGYGADEPPR